MEMKIVAIFLACVTVSQVDLIWGVPALNVGTIENKPWSFKRSLDDKKGIGLATELLREMFDNKTLQRQYKLNTTFAQSNEIGRWTGTEFTDGLLKEVAAGTYDIGGTGVVKVAGQGITWSKVFLSYNVTMLMKKELAISSIEDLPTSNASFIVVKDSPIDKLFDMCDTAITDAAKIPACKVLKAALAADTGPGSKVANASDALSAVKNEDSVWILDGAWGRYYSNNNCGLKVVDGGLFPRDTCQYAFPFAPSVNASMKETIDGAIAGVKELKLNSFEVFYLETRARLDNKETCGSRGLTFTTVTLIVSIIVTVMF